MSKSDWLVLEKYSFSLLPGEAKEAEGEALSYYQYLNARHQETGKNVQCVSWLLRQGFDHVTVEEPFGGCGVFSVALQGQLRPRAHRVIEIDEQCAAQLDHALEFEAAQVIRGDAHDLAGAEPAEVYVCDFPYFTYTRYAERGEWAAELRRMAAHRPRAILITDGSACRYHFVSAHLQTRGLPVTSDRHSYVQLMSRKLWQDIGYSVTECAWHGTCFYFRAEPVPPSDCVPMKHFPAGSGSAGLRRVRS